MYLGSSKNSWGEELRGDGIKESALEYLSTGVPLLTADCWGLSLALTRGPQWLILYTSPTPRFLFLSAGAIHIFILALFCVFECFTSVYVCVRAWCPRRRVSAALELEIRMLWASMQALGTELSSCARVTSTLPLRQFSSPIYLLRKKNCLSSPLPIYYFSLLCLHVCDSGSCVCRLWVCMSVQGCSTSVPAREETRSGCSAQSHSVVFP